MLKVANSQTVVTYREQDHRSLSWYMPVGTYRADFKPSIRTVTPLNIHQLLFTGSLDARPRVDWFKRLLYKFGVSRAMRRRFYPTGFEY